MDETLVKLRTEARVAVAVLERIEATARPRSKAEALV
jgi:hypothetical protein